MITQMFRGDLLTLFKTNDEIAIAHGITCHPNTWKTGFASKLKNAVPNAYLNDTNNKLGVSNKIGTIGIIREGEKKYIFNLYISRDVAVSNPRICFPSLVECLKKLNDYCAENRIKNLHIPMMGFFGNLTTFPRIQVLINQILVDVDVVLVD
jgi:hypothetical protein